jgi:hypothetical protein
MTGIGTLLSPVVRVIFSLAFPRELEWRVGLLLILAVVRLNTVGPDE